MAFLEIYRSGSLSAAAERLGVSQPAVSGQLARLESQLGEKLFVRSTRGAAPTARAGALAIQVGLHLDRVRGVLRPDGEGPLDGVLRIAGASEIMTLRVLPALSGLITRGLRVRATLGLSPELLDSLAYGHVDLVVASTRPRHPELNAVPFVDEEFLLVASPSLKHTMDLGRLVTEPVKALAHLPLVAYSNELPIIRRYWRSEFGCRPCNSAALIVPDLRAVLDNVIAGAGFSVLPRYIAHQALADGSIEQIHHPPYPPLNTLYLATRRGAESPGLLEARKTLLTAAAAWGAL
ncbi:LysR family transcriptional regulator [Kitasatospora sp. NPDC001603]|uniref:LysR family transcriptional regulator n=1 Tax=Kitasatospora sp. NPDC001603 TaxID=3154388 RepID=UPI00332E8D10